MKVKVGSELDGPEFKVYWNERDGKFVAELVGRSENGDFISSKDVSPGDNLLQSIKTFILTMPGVEDVTS